MTINARGDSPFDIAQGCRWLLPLLAVGLGGCGQSPERTFAPPPGEKVHQEVIHQSPKLDSIETDHRGSDGVATRVKCSTCHDVIDEGERAVAPKDLKEFHQGMQFEHGQLECVSCHEKDDPTMLHLATGQALPSSEAMQLCSQCHGPQRKSYDHGAHGGMNGHWDLSRGPRLRNNCVDCHDPHIPAIPQVLPAARPVDRGHSPAPHAGGGH